MLFGAKHKAAPQDKPAKPEAIEVDWGTWEWGEDTEILSTEGLGPCIGVAIYDVVAKIGHLAHVFPNQLSQNGLLRPFMNSVQHRTTGPPNLRGWIVGGATAEPESAWHSHDLALRQSALGQLARLGVSDENMTIAWNDDAALAVSMALDCGRGECDVSAYSLF